jgi:hypothetical protein
LTVSYLSPKSYRLSIASVTSQLAKRVRSLARPIAVAMPVPQVHEIPGFFEFVGTSQAVHHAKLWAIGNNKIGFESHLRIINDLRCCIIATVRQFHCLQ